MDNSTPIKTPMTRNALLDLDEGGNSVDLKLYRSMIGNMVYLTASRPDIIFSVACVQGFKHHQKSVI
jgi:hypothetical protein